MKGVEIEYFTLCIALRKVIFFIYQKINSSDRVPLREKLVLLGLILWSILSLKTGGELVKNQKKKYTYEKKKKKINLWNLFSVLRTPFMITNARLISMESQPSISNLMQCTRMQVEYELFDQRFTMIAAFMIKV